MIRLMDNITQVDGATEQLEFLIRRLERILRDQETMKLLNVEQCGRLLRDFAQASYRNVSHYQIIEHLVRQINQKLEDLRDSDVITLLKAYPYIPQNVRQANKLLSILNETVVSSSVQDKDQASLSFFVNYIHSFIDISAKNNSRDLTQDQKETMTRLLQEKIQAAGADFTAPNNLVLPLARILQRS